MSFILLGILNSQIDAAGGNSYDLLETQILTADAASVTFTGLDTLAAGYQHLQLRMLTRTSDSTAYDGLYLRLNADSGANYARHTLLGTGSSVISAANTSSNQIQLLSTGNGATSGSFSASITDILDFSNTSKNTTTRTLEGQTDGSTTQIVVRSGLWVNTSAVTSMTMTGANGFNFLTGSRFSLYGVKG